MTEKPSGEIQLLRHLKAKLITILSGQADYVLQHADSRYLVTPQGYRQIKTCRIPDEKVRDLLDHIIERGPEAAHGLLELLKDQELQETFPMLDFIKSIQVDSWSSGADLVTEKQLMTVARAMGQSWREIAVMALDVPSVKLEQIEADNRHHVDQVFATLRYWRNSRGNKATAAHLHALLSRPDLTLAPETFDFLLE